MEGVGGGAPLTRSRPLLSASERGRVRTRGGCLGSCCLATVPKLPLLLPQPPETPTSPEHLPSLPRLSSVRLVTPGPPLRPK